MEGVKTAKTTRFSFVFCKFFSPCPEQILLSVGDKEAMQTKVTAGKTLKRAGATPLFRLSAAQSSLGSLPPVTQEA